VLYISTWLCPSPYVYFNVSTQMCQNFCGGYYIEDANSSSCLQCTNPMCYTCDPNNSTYCLECAAYDHLFLDNGTCTCQFGYFYLTGSCVTCDSQNPGCLDCSYDMVSTILPFNSSDFQCYSCNQTLNYFLAGNFCVACSIPHCTVCSSLSSCQLCAATYSVDYTLTCSQCAVLGCLDCLPSSNLLCANCYTAGGFFIVPSTQQCASVCGDGLTAIGIEACDDGNTNSGDGCSSSCTI
jgi:cysteine-rich repeat protein